MNRIIKHTLQVEDRQMIQMPVGSTLLSVVVTESRPQLYVLVPYEPTDLERRIFRIVSAGEKFNSAGCTFIGTFVIDWYIGHLFEQVEIGQPDVRSRRYADDHATLRHMRPASIERDAVASQLSRIGAFPE